MPACAIASSWLRRAAPFDAAPPIVACAPTEACVPVSNDSMNADTSRRCWSPAAPAAKLNTVSLKKSNSVGTAPSCVNPKPRLFAVAVSDSKPVFSIMLRRWGTFMACGSASRLPLMMLEVPPVGIVWQVTHCTKSRLPVLKSCSPVTGLPPASEVLSDPSRFRFGFGGKAMLARYASMRFISVAVKSLSAPRSAVAVCANSAKVLRSPRQWKGSCPSRPISVCVAIGPFIGCQLPQLPSCTGSPRLHSSLKSLTWPDGSPRSHESWSMRASTWQLAHDACPRPEVACVSKRSGRPLRMNCGVGSKKRTSPRGESDDSSTTESEPPKRLSVMIRPRAASSTMPVGPSPTLQLPRRARFASENDTMFDEPRPVA